MIEIKKRFSICMIFVLLFVATGFPVLRIDSYAAVLIDKNTQYVSGTGDKIVEKGRNASKKAKESANKAKDIASERGKQVIGKSKDVANKGKGAVVKKGKQISDKVRGWYSNIDKDVFTRGWEHVTDTTSSELAVNVSAKYIDSVSDAIEKFGADVNASKGSARGVAQEAGFIAEKWHSDTFNIDAAAGSSSSIATVPGSNKLGSPDIQTNFGQEVSLKYYDTASGSAHAQAMTVIERYSKYADSTNDPLSFQEYLDKNGYDKSEEAFLKGVYEGQTRIIPADQYDDAVKYLEERVTTLKGNNTKTTTKLAGTYQETLENLSERLKDPKGTQSRPATKAEMEAVAELAMNGDFKPEDFGFTLSQVITPKYIVKQAINTGEKTAAMNMALTLGPEIYLVLVKAIETGQIDKSDLDKMGIDAVIAGSEGFVEGSVSSAILIACQSGKFGSQFTNVSPDVVGALTVIVIDSIRYGYALSKGEITGAQYSDLMAEEIISSAGSLSAGAGLALLFGGSQIAMLAGCMAGGMLAAIGYNVGKQAILEIRDAGGFAAVVPTDTVKGILVDNDIISSLKLNKASTLFNGMRISTLVDGKIALFSN